jgi:hypothetical protein
MSTEPLVREDEATEVGTVELPDMDAVVKCDGHECQAEATHGMGIRHHKSVECSVTVHLNRCDEHSKMIWAEVYEHIFNAAPCPKCDRPSWSVDDYIVYDRTI